MSDGLSEERPSATHALSHEVFGRALGAVTLLAWLSLHAQLETLFGPRGLIPMAQRIEALLDRDGAAALLSTPSVLHLLGGSLPAMQAVVLAGELAALAMIFGLVPGPAALLSYVLYLSMVTVGWPFLPLQWDTLLLEALVMAALLGRWRTPWPSRRALREPGPLARIAGYTLVTRLVFASGAVKLLSGDPTWRDGSALTFHHWTQPLPSPLAPLLHALPGSVHAIETVVTLVIEVGAPLLVLAGARGRRAFAAIVTALMLLIGLSGNYGFFNLLTVVLCIPLLDDEAITALMPRALRLAPRPAAPSADRARRWPVGAYLALAAIQLVTSLGVRVPVSLSSGYDALGRFHLASHYGLFAVMTTDRHELTFEATEDGVHWEAYDFWEKPGDPARGPRWCVPHMPRFDWMLWFAALDESGDVDPWIVRVAVGLLEDRPEARALFRGVPLGGRRPTAVRLVRSRYRFTTEVLGTEETWWSIEDRVVLRTFRRRE